MEMEPHPGITEADKIREALPKAVSEVYCRYYRLFPQDWQWPKGYGPHDSILFAGSYGAQRYSISWRYPIALSACASRGTPEARIRSTSSLNPDANMTSTRASILA